MILVDANLLLYAYNERAAEHSSARRWFESVLGAGEPVALAWPVVLAFLRIATDARISRPPLRTREAVEIADAWFSQYGAVPLVPGERHWRILAQLIVESQCSGPLLSDAHLAALAIEHGALLCSTDRDFARFAGLRWTNPLTKS